MDINKFERVDTWLQKSNPAREGNVFRNVCQSFCPRWQGGVGFPACMTRGLHPGVCIWGSLSRGSVSRWSCIQGGLHPGGSASRDVCIGGSASTVKGMHLGGLHPDGLWGDTHCLPWGDWQTPLMTSSGGHCSGRYASYWNAFLQFYEFYKETSLFRGGGETSIFPH